MAERSCSIGRRSVTSSNHDQNATTVNRQCADPRDTAEHNTQFLMTSETVRAVEAVKFIAAHLRTEDDYAEV